jgi:hypothetical protein
MAPGKAPEKFDTRAKKDFDAVQHTKISLKLPTTLE